MAFIFGGGRSTSPVVEHAQKVVADLQVALQEKDKRIKSLENTAQSLHEMTFLFLRDDVARLLERRSQIHSELQGIDDALNQRAVALKDLRGFPGAPSFPIDDLLNSIARVKIESIASKGVPADFPGRDAGGLPGRRDPAPAAPRAPSPTATNPMAVTSSPSKVHVLSNTILSTKAVISPGTHTPSDLTNEEDSVTNEIEDIEEVLCVIREFEPQMLFIIERSNGSDVVVYILPNQPVESIVSAYRLRQFDDRDSMEQLSSHEKAVAFGAVVVPNHDRDDPDVQDLSVVMSSPARASSASQLGCSGELIGAIELPVAPDIIIDLWRAELSTTKPWATTTINGVKFCVLERLFVRSETVWGITSVVEITLFGRHPRTWDIVVENIDLTATNE